MLLESERSDSEFSEPLLEQGCLTRCIFESWLELEQNKRSLKQQFKAVSGFSLSENFLDLVEMN